MDLGMRHSDDDQPHSESRDPMPYMDQDSQRQSVARGNLKEGQSIWTPSLLKQFLQCQWYSGM